MILSKNEIDELMKLDPPLVEDIGVASAPYKQNELAKQAIHTLLSDLSNDEGEQLEWSRNIGDK